MASRSTRSSGRRSEGLQLTSENCHNIATVATTPMGIQQHYHRQQHHHVIINAKEQANTSRKKRPREDNIIIPQPILPIKKARYAVEIESKPFVLPTKPKSRSVIINTPSNAKTDPILRSPPQQATISKLVPPQAEPPRSTIHHQKVANGIKHELDRLHHSENDTKDEKRKLRSQEGTRFKSELSLYFPEYDEVIGNDPKEEHILNFDTPIVIIDNPKPPAKPLSIPLSTSANTSKLEYPVKNYPNSLFETLHDAQRIDFSFLDSHCKDKGEDPLPDSFYETVHKKPERHEKSIRNTDKGRAQHEKDQVIRLLEGLQGHDWLKLMGVSGITDTRKKEFEPARDHFIKGCLTIIEKFKTWREEEKRRKISKEQAMAVAEVEEVVEAYDDANGNQSDGDPPDYSDVDASAAKQLHEEAIARSAPVATSKRQKTKVDEPPISAPAPPIEKDFKSFFAKPYLREAALHKHRRSGRSVSAWGQPVPDIAGHDFNLPEEYRDDETLRIHARRRRRDRRVSRE